MRNGSEASEPLRVSSGEFNVLKYSPRFRITEHFELDLTLLLLDPEIWHINFAWAAEAALRLGSSHHGGLRNDEIRACISIEPNDR